MVVVVWLACSPGEWLLHAACVLHWWDGNGRVVAYSLVEWWWHAGWVLRVQVKGWWWSGGGSGVVVACILV